MGPDRVARTIRRAENAAPAHGMHVPAVARSIPFTKIGRPAMLPIPTPAPPRLRYRPQSLPLQRLSNSGILRQFLKLAGNGLGRVLELLRVVRMVFKIFNRLFLDDREGDRTDDAQCSVHIFAQVKHEPDMGMRQEYRCRTRRHQYRMQVDPDDRIEMFDRGQSHARLQFSGRRARRRLSRSSARRRSNAPTCDTIHSTTSCRLLFRRVASSSVKPASSALKPASSACSRSPARSQHTALMRHASTVINASCAAAVDAAPARSSKRRAHDP